MVIDIGFEYHLMLIDDFYVNNFHSFFDDKKYYVFEKSIHTFYSRKELKKYINDYINSYISKYHFIAKTKKEFLKRYKIRVEKSFHFSYRVHSFDMLPKHWFVKKSKWFEHIPETYKGFPVEYSLMRDVH